jgi:hypothetical protein
LIVTYFDPGEGVVHSFELPPGVVVRIGPTIGGIQIKACGVGYVLVPAMTPTNWNSTTFFCKRPPPAPTPMALSVTPSVAPPQQNTQLQPPAHSTSSGTQVHPQALTSASAGTTLGAQSSRVPGYKTSAALRAQLSHFASPAQAHKRDADARLTKNVPSLQSLAPTSSPASWVYLVGFDPYGAQYISAVFPGDATTCSNSSGNFAAVAGVPAGNVECSHDGNGHVITFPTQAAAQDNKASIMAAEHYHPYKDVSYPPTTSASQQNAISSNKLHPHFDSSYNRSKCITLGPAEYGQIGGRQFINHCGGKIEVVWCTDGDDNLHCKLSADRSKGPSYGQAMWTVGNVPQASSTSDDEDVYFFACANDDGLTLPQLTSPRPPRGNCWRAH